MEELYFTDRTYGVEDLVEGRLSKGEYDGCSFIQLDLSGADLMGCTFMDCRFEACNLGNAKVKGTALKSVAFVDCKLTGIHFRDCVTFLFAVSFERCKLDLSSFHKMPMKETVFRDCSLQEADLSETDLSRALFDRCDLAGALFEGTNLEKCDLRTAVNYSIDPARNRIKKARFTLAGLPGLLDRYGIDIEA